MWWLQKNLTVLLGKCSTLFKKYGNWNYKIENNSNGFLVWILDKTMSQGHLKCNFFQQKKKFLECASFVACHSSIFWAQQRKQINFRKKRRKTKKKKKCKKKKVTLQFCDFFFENVICIEVLYLRSSSSTFYFIVVFRLNVCLPSIYKSKHFFKVFFNSRHLKKNSIIN
jgi:hypothetical protein